MTISTSANKAVGLGNGVNVSWPYLFLIPDAAALYVYYTDLDGNITAIPGGSYTVTGLGNPNGGSVTYPLVGSPIATGTSLTVYRSVPYTQLVDVTNQGDFYPEVYESALDQLEIQLQQIYELISRSLRSPVYDTTNQVISGADWAARANKSIGFDASGNITLGLTFTGTGTDLTLSGLIVTGNTQLGNAITDTLTIWPNVITWSGNPSHTGNHVFTGQVVFNGAQVSVSGVFITNGDTYLGNDGADVLQIAMTNVTWTNNPTHSGNHTFTGNVTVNGNTTIGNAAGDTLTIAPSAVTWSGNPTHSGNHTFSGTVTAAGTVTPQGLLDISGASAGRIQFPAAQNASANVNTLDDYEEGTFTITIGGSVTPGTQTYSTQVGRYTKVGHRCFGDGSFVMTAKDGATSGNLTVSGIPFTAANVSNYRPACSVMWGTFDLNTGGGYSAMAARVITNTATIILVECGDNVAQANLTEADLAATSALNISFNYETT